VVLYQLLTGRLPFASESMDGLFQKILTEAPQPPSACNPSLGPEIDSTILRALAKDAEMLARPMTLSPELRAAQA